jgi:hypothetical protein
MLKYILILILFISCTKKPEKYDMYKGYVRVYKHAIWNSRGNCLIKVGDNPNNIVSLTAIKFLDCPVCKDTTTNIFYLHRDLYLDTTNKNPKIPYNSNIHWYTKEQIHNLSNSYKNN